MKCVRVPSSRNMTLQPTKRAPWSAIALTVRSSFARDDENPGTIGFIRTPALMPASTSSRTARSRCSGGAVPGSSSSHACSSTVGTLMYTVQVVTREISRSKSRSRTTIGPFVTSPIGLRAPRSASSAPRVSL